MTDVERVARAVRLERLVRSGNSTEVAAICTAAVFIGTDELLDIAAAMRETRLIDAEALEADAAGSKDLVSHAHRYVAGWLQSRATLKEQTDDQ